MSKQTINQASEHPTLDKLQITLCDALDAIRDLIHAEIELPNEIGYDLPHIEWILGFCESMIDGVIVPNIAAHTRRKLLDLRQEQRRQKVEAREAEEQEEDEDTETPAQMILVPTPLLPVRKKNYWEAD